jgi:RIO-like serine/threonine protein kinase
MSDLIDTLIKMLKYSNAGYVKAKVGEYTIFVTDDDDGAKVLDAAWENYVEESEG